MLRYMSTSLVPKMPVNTLSSTTNKLRLGYIHKSLELKNENRELYLRKMAPDTSATPDQCAHNTHQGMLEVTQQIKQMQQVIHILQHESLASYK